MSALTLVKLSYFVAATLFLLGLQRMASPRTARSGIQWAGVGMLIATIATFFLPGLHNIGLMVAAIVIGVGLNWVWGKKVAITDMPVVISLYNAFTGLAVAFEGYVLGNEALIIAGTMVGAAGMLLTRLMAKAMNRKISNVLFSNFGGGGAAMQEIGGSMKPIEAADVAAMMAYAERVVIVPGYGLAVAQAQHKIWELTQRLQERGVKVKFAIHPVAGRMPGHMNVLLAEASVPYDDVFELEDINSEFAQTDVAFVIGANDVTNPAAKTDKTSPIYGMPVLDVEKAKTVLFVKRSMGGVGYAGVDNDVFYMDNTMMLLADAKKMVEDIVKAMAH